MGDEKLRRAVELARDGDAGGEEYQIIARAWLAEHPADDAEPCGHDLDWLRSAGFRPVGHLMLHDNARLPWRVLVDQDGRLLLYGDVVAETPTRGDVRALLRALKVPTKEGG